MSVSWKNALKNHHDQNFRVFPRENLLHASLETLLHDLSVSLPTRSFLQQLADPNLSVWEAFFASVRSVHKDIQEHDIFPPLKRVIERVTHVAVLYGEHVTWASPDQWCYLLRASGLQKKSQAEYFIVHAPATLEQIQQAEAILGMQLPAQYVQFLKATNGFGIDLQELDCIYGVGSARADWDEVQAFPTRNIDRTSEYHEIASRWLEWQDVLAYERQRDRETNMDTFLSDERVLVPFAYTFDDWCFDRSRPTSKGEYPIFLWDHELREATYTYPDFETWFNDTATKNRP